MEKETLIVLSMTTIPGRWEKLRFNIDSLINQSFKFDELVINIDDNAPQEFIDNCNSLSNLDNRIKINLSDPKWRSCNKLLPTLKMYPDDIIITVDDDISYPVDTIKELVDEFTRQLNLGYKCIIAHEINPIVLDYNEAAKQNFINVFNFYDVMLGQREFGKYLSNCCLFPPHVFDNTDLYDYEKMMACTKGQHDELWFWVNSTLNGVQCVGLDYVASFQTFIGIPYEKDEYQLSNLNNNHETLRQMMLVIHTFYGDRLIKEIQSKSVEFVITRHNASLFRMAAENINNIYNYGYKITFDKSCNQSHKNFITEGLNRITSVTPI